MSCPASLPPPFASNLDRPIAMLLTLLLLVPTPSVPLVSTWPLAIQAPQEVDYARTEAVALERTVDKLADLAEWCQKNRAYLQRARAYETILLWDSGHEAARKSLGWKWDKKTGDWKQKRKPRTPKDGSKESAIEAIAKRAEVLGALRDTLLAALDADEKVTPGKRQRVMDKMISAMPNDAVLRARNGQVLALWSTEEAPVWILKASHRALEQRQVLAKLRAKLFAEDSKVKTVDMTESEQRLSMDWAAVKGNKRVRALSTYGADEAERALHACSVAVDYTRDLFGHRLQPNLTLYLIDTDAEKAQFIQAWPGIDDERRARLTRMAGAALSHEHMSAWGDHTDKRVDSVLRQVLSIQMSQRFGLTGDSAWIHEGFGMYLTHDLIGTRLSFFIQPTDYVDDGAEGWDRKLYDPSSDWLALAREELENPKRPNLAFTLGREINEFTSKDLVLSYALASFFMEGHEPELTRKLMTEIGNGKNPIQTVEAVLGYDLKTLSKRLHLFLVETGS